MEGCNIITNMIIFARYICFSTKQAIQLTAHYATLSKDITLLHMFIQLHQLAAHFQSTLCLLVVLSMFSASSANLEVYSSPQHHFIHCILLQSVSFLAPSPPNTTTTTTIDVHFLDIHSHMH